MATRLHGFDWRRPCTTHSGNSTESPTRWKEFTQTYTAPHSSFIQGLLADRSSKYTRAQDRMYMVDSGASLPLMEKVLSLSAGKNTRRQTNADLQTARGFHKRGQGLYLAFSCSWWQFRFRYCLLDDDARSWCILALGNQRGPHISQRDEDHVQHRQFGSSLRGRSADSHSTYQARPGQEKPSLRKLLARFSENLQPKTELGETPLREPNLLWL